MYFGIDLGTSNSAITGVSFGQVRIFKTPEGTDIMPSVIHRDKRGNQTVGVRAFALASLAPDNAVDGFKRLMGTDTPLRFASTGDTITPEQASSEILKSLVGQALIESGSTSITGVVVTIPAAFNQLQSEATLEAAHAAGLTNVALIQEPVAAALAAMAGLQDRNGLFLIYDLGGGTFDAALVHAVDGDITVLGHEGVNSLGGRDLDRRIMESVALPWLKRTFELPSDFATTPSYMRLMRMARRSAEVAKIALSTKEQTTISASDEEVRLTDLRGEPIYLDVPLARRDLESMASDMITRSIACCRDLLAHVGYRHEDVARVVLIGGPTKMPFLRKQVEDGLGIQVEDITRIDPMTAVAAGAAIYCEGRDWSATGSTAKQTHHRETGGRAIEISFDYQIRTASENARLELKQVTGPAGVEVIVESFLGWSTGRRKLTGSLVLDLPLKDSGMNEFKVTVFDSQGLPVADASRKIMIDRLLASTGGVPATHAIAVKILDEKSGRNVLGVLVEKGRILPATGVVTYRLANPLRAGSGGMVSIELYQVSDMMVTEPHLNLMVGEFQVRESDLPQSMALKTGDLVLIHWAVSEGQLISAEVEFPSVQQRFDNSKFKTWQVARQNFSGEEGAKLASSQIRLAQKEIEEAEEAVPPAFAAPLPRIRDRLDTQTSALSGSLEPDARRTVVEEVRLLRQEIARVCQQTDARRHLLRQRLAAQRRFYDRDIIEGATKEQAVQVDELLRSADAWIDQGDVGGFDTASDQINRVRSLYWMHGFDQDKFCAWQFSLERENRYLASDPAKFERFVAEGDRALAKADFKSVRSALINIVLDQVSIGSDMAGREKASLMRA
jgi:molecular chaperone DnaK